MVTRTQAYAPRVPRTSLCDLLRIEHPILSVGFGRTAGPELVAAVSSAGACGVLGGSNVAPEVLRERIRGVRDLTERPFGVNLLLHAPQLPQLEVCIEERVPLLVTFWGDPAPYVARARASGALVFHQVGSVDEARQAARAGVDAVIAQGGEAGGHVRGTVALAALLPAVVDAIGPLPVLAAGGIADGRGIAAALALGAVGVSLGTRFVASEEAYTLREYKDRLVRSTAADTVYSEFLFDGLWPGAPHRALRNGVVREWESAGCPPSGQRPGEGTVIARVSRADGTELEVKRYSSFMITPEIPVDIEEAPLWAGQSVELIHDVKPAGQIVRDLVREADALL